MTRLQHLANAITICAGYADPSGELYESCNPGGLKSHSYKHPKTLSGYRKFQSFVDGYQALLYDLKVKCEGRSKSGLTPTSELYRLLNTLGYSHETQEAVAEFLRIALGDSSLLSLQSHLEFFLED